MKPIVKYQGGKTRELPLIKQLLPSDFSRVIEPFCGGAAVSFELQKPAILNDINPMLINLYKVVQSSDYVHVLDRIEALKTYEHDALQEVFYSARSIINNPENFTPLIQAISYIIVRQLCYSGMERYNAKGKFNVPFGHYKSMACNLGVDHHEFLNKCDIRKMSFGEVFYDVNEDDFLFVDPPYLERLGYTEGDGGLSLHEDLLSCLKATTGRWMIIHSDHEFYREKYKDFNIIERDFAYAQRFGKDRDHSGSKVKHLYITNY